MGYKTVPQEFDLNTEFPTWIIAFCPDTDSWFVTNKRFFYYEYEQEFATEEKGIQFFVDNTKSFYDLEIQMGFKPFNKNGLWLENVSDLIEL